MTGCGARAGTADAGMKFKSARRAVIDLQAVWIFVGCRMMVAIERDERKSCSACILRHGTAPQIVSDHRVFGSVPLQICDTAVFLSRLFKA
jgi:hypothetical protein